MDVIVTRTYLVRLQPVRELMLRPSVDELRQWVVVAESSVVGDYCPGQTGSNAY